MTILGKPLDRQYALVLYSRHTREEETRNMTIQFQVYNNEKYGGEAKSFSKSFGSQIELTDYINWLRTYCGWTSVCWFAV